MSLMKSNACYAVLILKNTTLKSKTEDDMLRNKSLIHPKTTWICWGTQTWRRCSRGLDEDLEQQQMGVFQASIMQTLQSLKDEIKSVKKINFEVEMGQISTSDPKPGPSKQPDLQNSPNTNLPSNKPSDEPMATVFACLPLPPQFIQKFESEIRSDMNSKETEGFAVAKLKKHSDKRKHNVWTKLVTSSSSSEESEASVQVKKSSKPKGAASEQDKQKTDQILYFIVR